VNDYAGGVLYVTFWILVAIFLNPRWSAGKVALSVLAVTFLVEFLQLWHPPPLERLRDSFRGRTFLGNSFSSWDLPHYVAGALLGYGLVVAVRTHLGRSM
jgi:hypothetical protein